ncbi:MAG: sulfotransferase, partial [Proteobacteria bacterium]|nr:sulfotransferase [Pseudomonadota bacterium]
ARLEVMLAGRRPKPGLEARARSMLGDALSAEGRPAEAFAAYEAANAILKREHAGAYAAPGMPSVLDMANWLLGHFQGADPADWASAPPAPAPGPGEPARHIFFVGFPRSGTTLLEQVLASHPDVVALEEREVLPAVTKDLFATDEGLARLARIGADEAAAFRQAYWRGVADWCPDLAGKTFVDKLPLTSVWLPVVSKLFPNAKVLFARRDPRDVVLSCFRRRFGMNPAMYQFLTLDGTAAYYDAVMRLSETYARLLPTPVMAYRYEDLVEDFEREVRRICEFMGLAWNDSMLDFAATAERRPIRTPSARQVRRGLYSEGVGQWRPFAAELAPVAPLLDPWVRAFGYPET